MRISPTLLKEWVHTWERILRVHFCNLSSAILVNKQFWLLALLGPFAEFRNTTLTLSPVVKSGRFRRWSSPPRLTPHLVPYRYPGRPEQPTTSRPLAAISGLLQIGRGGNRAPP